MGFSLHRTEIRQSEIPPTAFSEQIAKFNVHQYFCSYGILYRIAQNFGGTKLWQFPTSLPKFYPPIILILADCSISIGGLANFWKNESVHMPNTFLGM